MEYEEFKSELIKQLKKIDIEIDEEKVIKFYKYMNLLFSIYIFHSKPLFYIVFHNLFTLVNY